MQRYYVPRHVYVCPTPEGAVFLDLKRDRYVGIGPPVALRLQRLVAGWSQDSVAGHLDASIDVEEAVKALQSNGLLTQDETQGKSATPPILQRPESSLASFEPLDSTSVSARDALHFTASCVRARAKLTLLPLERVVHDFSTRKKRFDRRRIDHEETELHRLMRVYVRLRPFFFGYRDACLFDSLVCVEYLAGHGFFPTWVLGVKTGPFGAHSWVQHGGVVVNDLPERARAYTPILAV